MIDSDWGQAPSHAAAHALGGVMLLGDQLGVSALTLLELIEDRGVVIAGEDAGNLHPPWGQGMQYSQPVQPTFIRDS